MDFRFERPEDITDLEKGMVIHMSLLTLVVPCYNEEAVIDNFYQTSKEILKDLDMDMEYVFVDDGSKDTTLDKLVTMAEEFSNVRYVSFSRNFGKEAAIFAGLHKAKGDAVVVLDADLQHPPVVIYQMVELWKQGYEVVEGVKNSRGKEGLMHKFMANTFYGLISKMMGIDMNNSSDFKLLDRKVVEVLCSLKERNTFFRALSFWVGYQTTTVSYDVQERAGGKSKWSGGALVKYAVKNLISFTDSPLHFISVTGILFMLMGIWLTIDAIIDHVNGVAVEGYPTLIIMLVIATGCILFSIGIIGVYIAKIYDEIKERPQYIIRKESE